MPTLSINGVSVTVPEGATLLEAVRHAGFDLPTLCTESGRRPLSSCYLCAVQIKGSAALQPACSARAEQEQEVSTTSAELATHRRITLEMLLSHHAGDCEAPCTLASRAALPIPALLRQIQRRDFGAAATLLMSHLPFPETAANSLLSGAEKACRRGSCDRPVGIRDLVGFLAGCGAADEALRAAPRRGGDAPRMAVLGAGPGGLAAAAFLCLRGCSVELFGSASPEHWPASLRQGEAAESLQRDIDRITRAVARHESCQPFKTPAEMQAFASGFGATLATPESALPSEAAQEAAEPAAGLYILPPAGEEASSVAETCARIRSLARAMDRHAAASPPAADRPTYRFNCSLGRLRNEEEKRQLLAMAPAANTEGGGEGNAAADSDEALREAKRCMHCDCRKALHCRLRQAAEELELGRARNAQTRPDVEIVRTGIGLVFEPGKCIHCGRCIEITETEGEPVGLTWSGRGFGVRVSPPPGLSWADALQHTADACVAACPTAALAYED